jgi:hypothetical protein
LNFKLLFIDPKKGAQKMKKALIIAMTAFAFLSCEAKSKSSEQEKKKESFKETLKEKAKEKAREILKKISDKLAVKDLTNEEKEFLVSEFVPLIDGIHQGNLLSMSEACDLFNVDSVLGLDELMASIVYEIVQNDLKDPMNFVLCGTYIGDDGLEYDDGIDETQEANAVSFYGLPIHLWEKKIIEKIVTSLAEKSLPQLLLERKEMEKRGDQVRHVHPLRFMGIVFSDSYLKSCLPQFRNQAFKWSNFIGGYSDRMREELAKNNLLQHVDGFADYLNADAAKIKEFINKGQFEDIINYLLDK